MAFLPSIRKKIYQEDVQGGSSVSESIGARIGSTINFIYDYIVQKLEFGVDGIFSGLTMPYYGLGANEIAVENYEIARVFVSLENCGASGQTEFYIQKRTGLGAWSSIFSTNCVISNTASDPVSFRSDDLTAPSGVTLPVLNTTSIVQGDEIRFVLVSAGTQAENLTVNLEVRPL